MKVFSSRTSRVTLHTIIACNRKRTMEDTDKQDAVVGKYICIYHIKNISSSFYTVDNEKCN